MSNMSIGVKNGFKNYLVNYRKIFIWEKKKVNDRSEYVYSGYIKPSGKFHTIEFDLLDSIRIFPSHTPSKLPKWPDEYWITLINGEHWKWKCCVDIKNSDCPPKCDEIELEGEFLLIFQAPSNFPCLKEYKEYKENGQEKIRLVISGKVPPMWWVEIFPPPPPTSISGITAHVSNPDDEPHDPHNVNIEFDENGS
ncbi:MAG: hypothetical protein JSV88_21015 [Candidatus Aminicenantes bacterium]|nr:MAG: hypothetical protein JSV88_21015 [Candidatus Aminicenantes bacterium]